MQCVSYNPFPCPKLISSSNQIDAYRLYANSPQTLDLFYRCARQDDFQERAWYQQYMRKSHFRN